MSHLTRGAWIEILNEQPDLCLLLGRTSHEVRGLKFKTLALFKGLARVAPHTRCVD